MAKKNDTGVFQLDNGNWAYRIYMSKDANGNKVDTTCRKDESGNPFTSKKMAVDARTKRLVELKTPTPKKSITDVTIGKVWEEYLSTESKGKAQATVTKQKSLWKNHIKDKFEKVKLSELTVVDVETFLQELYDSGLSYHYVESFIKFFFLVGGIAYRKEWIDPDKYYRMFQDKGTKIRMPKMSQEDLEDEFEVASFQLWEIAKLDDIFKRGCNDESHGNLYTAFLLGYYLGVRIGECFGLRWTDINWEDKTITINSMKYWSNIIKAETEIDFKYHSLRKTHLSQLAEMNTPVIETMKRAGHKKYETTMRYYINTTTETKLRLLNNINTITLEEPTIMVDIGNGETKEMKQSDYLKLRKFSETFPH